MTALLKRSGHAVNRKHIQRLMREMGIEAIYPKPDLSKPHPGHTIYPYLLKGSDGEILHIIKMWLAAPVREMDEDGKQRNVGGGKGNTRGTPQGGVISPLLSNLYLHVLDRQWERQGMEKTLGARIVRYADDVVVLCRYGTEQPFEKLREALDGLAFRLNEVKTRVVDACKGDFDFLGFAIGSYGKEQENGELLSPCAAVKEIHSDYQGPGYESYGKKPNDCSDGSFSEGSQHHRARMGRILSLSELQQNDGPYPLPCGGTVGRAIAQTSQGQRQKEGSYPVFENSVDLKSRL
jgi:hypothetical protein